MREMNAQEIIITMRDGSVFRGLINMGSCRRLSDFFRKIEATFIVLFDATVGEGSEKGVYFLNRTNILWAKPGDGFTHSEKKIQQDQEEEID
ncbi:MAG: hypothetical protein AB9866_10395 [Syntrophobacteraceae bacterium]